MQKNKIKILAGEGVRFLGPHFSPVSGAVAVTFRSNTGRENIVPKNVIIATGSSPKTLPNLPLDENLSYLLMGCLN